MKVTEKVETSLNQEPNRVSFSRNQSCLRLDIYFDD